MCVLADGGSETGAPSTRALLLSRLIRALRKLKRSRPRTIALTSFLSSLLKDTAFCGREMSHPR